MNPFLTDYDEPLKISDEMRDAILDECRSDSSKIIEYLEEQKFENDKQLKIDRRINIATLIISILSLLWSIRFELLALLQEVLKYIP